MKIPVYDQQVAYHASMAQNVALAQPLRQTHQNKFWNIMQELGETAAGLGKVWKAAKDKQEEDAKKAAQRGLQPGLSPVQPQEGLFSAPNRQELLQFAQTKTFGAQADASISPVERLDNYFSAQLQQSPENSIHPDSLLGQDYAIIRRETEHLQQEEEKACQQEKQHLSERHFIQTASLVRSPQALESYINDNCTQAAKEFGQKDPSLWARQREALYTQAVQHNINTALACAEPAQAQAVYAHFEKRFSEKERQRLQNKIRWGRAQENSERLFERASAQCLDEAGRLDKEALAQFMTYREGKDEELNKQTYMALSMRLRERQNRILLQRAEQYEKLLSEEASSRQALFNGRYESQEEWSRAVRAVCQKNNSSYFQSSPSVFNSLFENDDRERLSKTAAAFDEGALSAQDFLSLYADGLRTQAKGADKERRLLSQSLERLGRKENCSEEELASTKYFVYTSASDMSGRWQTARKVRRMFHLQEEQK